MTRIYAPHKPHNKKKLASVIELMKQLGPPLLRAFHVTDQGKGNDYYQTLEGSHRLEAARLLGLPVNLELKEKHHDVGGWHDFSDSEGDTVQDLLDYINKNSFPSEILELQEGQSKITKKYDKKTEARKQKKQKKEEKSKQEQINELLGYKEFHTKSRNENIHRTKDYHPEAQKQFAEAFQKEQLNIDNRLRDLGFYPKIL